MKNKLWLAALAAICLPQAVLADKVTRADSHAPIGVMADHFHKKGEWMFSYRFMNMAMQGNLLGSDSISPDAIVTTIPNRFFGMPGQPPTLRVVPLEMDMDMHMIGMMYAPSDRVTMAFMGNYLRKDMRHVTYMGGAGTTTLGEFTTKTSGWGDTTLSALVSFHDTEAHKIHAIVGVSMPTGSTEETGTVLTPMNMTPTIRLPYPMQLGSGTWDPIAGLSYSGFSTRFGWGAQWRSTFRSGDNDEGYNLGNEHCLTGWVSYLFNDSFSGSLRLEYLDRDNIDGIDPAIVAPVQTADPDRYGLSRTDASIGLNWAGQGDLNGYRIALEYSVPVDQDLDGPQMETDSRLILGLQKSF